MQKKLLAIIAGIILFAGGFTAGHFIDLPDDDDDDLIFLEAEEVEDESLLGDSAAVIDLDIGTFDQVWRTAMAKFVDVEKLDPKKMLYGAMKGVIESLGDPHSEFLTPTESEQFLASLEGELIGVGAEVGIRDEIITIISPLRGSPAERAGLLPGDKVFKIDDEISSDLTLFEAVKKIRGEIGSQVKLTIFRGEEMQSREITITRELIDIKSVNSEMREDGIAMVTVNTFAEDTAEEFTKILADLALQNPKGMVLDLRFNGGGFLDVAIEIASKLLPSGNVVVIHERGKADQVIPVSGAPLLPQTPLVVLINEGSASSSEIVAGALQDNARATLVGTKSFGKGTVQELISNFSDGSTLRISIAKWFTPNGRDIDKIGIEPDFEVGMALEDYFSKKDPQLDAAVEFLQTGTIVKVENSVEEN
ncbi:S41 family peptidase [Candidatus Gracilibacteria bacterium]|nr:S41 family peptidase [Candidatus Gracilibacteria bacterium]MCF7856441.1 S41 family peptidase [Candidatus Gracilibacteria bacterium]MCF7896564.1 S41 family peptidase [Candidatus Gracilibacteria bacterium]